MTGWEFLRTIGKDISVERRKLIFFVLLLAVGITINYFWHKRIEAQSITGKSQAIQSNSLLDNWDIKVTKSGQVYINNQKNNQVLSYYDDYDELRILVFDKPGRMIENFRAEVGLPGDVNQNDVRQIIYAVHGVGETKVYIQDPRTLVYEANNVSPYAMLTIVAYLPKNLISPGIFETIKFQIQKLPLKIWFYIAIIFPLFTVIFMAIMLIIRRSSQLMRSSALANAPPDDLSPAIVGVLVDGNVGSREISATLIDLARRGYMFIINKGDGEFSFGIRKSANLETMQGLSSFEKALLSKIFLPKGFKSTTSDIEMRIGRHIFSRKIARFYLDIYNQATKMGFFVKNPGKVHLVYKYIGVVLFFVSFICFLINAAVGADPKFSLLLWVGGMAAAAMIMKISAFMPTRAAAGTQELSRWLAFRNFLVIKRRLVASEVLQAKFEAFLPYAIVFGVEVEWTKRFADEPFSKPDWYESNERAVSIESFAGQLLPLIGYVSRELAKSHEPTIE